MGSRPRVSFAAILLGSGPRFARDAAGPVVAFYIAWKLVGLGAGIAVGTTVAVVAFVWERRRARSGVGAVIGLSIALVQALVGAVSSSTVGYFMPAVLANGIWGLIFLGSVVVGRPLAGVFARETYSFPPDVQASSMFRRTFSTISLAWAALLIARTVLRLVVLWWGSVDLFVATNIATGVPLTIALMTWSVWYGVRSFTRSVT
jgi:intracellular septation protein A